MAIVATVLLILTIFVRPQEFIPGLASLKILNALTGLAALAIPIEAFLGRKKRSFRSPQLRYLAAFLLWGLVSTLIRVGPGGIEKFWRVAGFSAIFMLVVMYGSGTIRRLLILVSTLCIVSVFLIAVGAVQSQSEFECFELVSEEGEPEPTTGVPTNHPCTIIRDCYAPDEQLFDKDYLCEKRGLFQTHSIGRGRVRWRGILEDPNELSLAIGASLAFAFALHSSMKGKIRHLLLLLLAAGASFVVVQTQSRGGVLVLLATFGAYFVRRFGWKGAVAAAAVGTPLFLLGGREGEEARASTLERVESLYVGIDMVKDYPLFGVGLGQYTDHHFLTAHNSYLLVASELGLVGMFLWSLLMYVSVKIPFTLAFGKRYPAFEPLRPFAVGLSVAFVGILTGIFFLSFSYHNMLFIYLGLAGALYTVAKELIPEFDIKIRAKEALVVFAFNLTFLVLLFVYTRLRM